MLTLVRCSDASGPVGFDLTVLLVGQGDVTSDPTGLTCSGGTCSGTFDEVTSVTLGAIAAADHRFGQWADACTGNESCVVVMDGDKSVTASFEPKVEANGLSPEINDLVPDTLLATMMELGMQIHGGPSPPDLEAAFRALRSRCSGATFLGTPPRFSLQTTCCSSPSRTTTH